MNLNTTNELKFIDYFEKIKMNCKNKIKIIEINFDKFLVMIKMQKYNYSINILIIIDNVYFKTITFINNEFFIKAINFFIKIIYFLLN